jgi:hypothetical protein
MDLETATNEDFALSFDLSDGTAAIDLTGAALDMKVRGASGTALELSTTNGAMSVHLVGNEDRLNSRAMAVSGRRPQSQIDRERQIGAV